MGFEKGREGKTENLVVYQVVGTFPECLPTLRLVAGGRACPRTPGLPFDPAGGTLPKPAACYWTAQPGSFFREGAVLLHKASQSGPLSIIVINSNKMSEQGCLDRTCL